MLTEFKSEIIKNNFNVYGIVVIKDGIKVAEHHFMPEERRQLYSVTKSFTSTAVGLAISEGYFSINDNVLKFFQDEIPKNISPEHLKNLEKVTVERLLTMSIQDYPFVRLTCDNWLKHILSVPVPNIDEKVFQYSNWSSYLAGAIVEKTTKMNLIQYLQLRLFEPLGIENVECEYSPEGHFYGATGMKLTINELSRFGQVYLQEGYYNGKQLLPKEWVASATKKQIETREGGYGYYFWRYKENCYRASGMRGQMCIVIPDKNAVIAVMSDLENDSEEVRQCIWDTIYTKL
ncbi:serine hydrolase domain-containing protein [Inconstantimicrobium mannanitabidum]|uniref:Penicillin-binding protein n=1 Tax=Inconstantimicrobium mannanitabidum TaxID=1604901 RepID=A0ACB5RBF2_9CLOT|nr:serine hydrolase [Clostridium sp. TW13]GKX66477.1 penicillin-binding protein [Clostridium sp. TW13]